MKIETIVKSDTRFRDGLADIRIKTELGQEHQLDLPFRDMYRRCGVPSRRALDLLIVAGVCYIIDKTVSRADAADGWTRQLEISIAVSDTEPWKLVSRELAETLTFLTGDVWVLDFYQSPVPLFEVPESGSEPLISPTQAVSLFSGGLDSLAGAVDLLSSAVPEKVLFIGHYDSGGPKKIQGELASRLNEHYPNRFGIEHIRVSHRPSKGVEETLRSRSFVFIALGLYAAQAFGTNTPLYMFENGLIALNVPLTPSRRGSCSTRTMHPYYLHKIRGVMSALGISNPIFNPYALKTKGECLTECRNREILFQLADTSVSCSHASRRQYWKRKSANNCGYCVPCIFRRAALRAAGLDRGDVYGMDVLTGELTVDDQLESSTDLRAVTDFLRRPCTVGAIRKELLATAYFPDLEAHAEMACRGFAELRRWFESASLKSEKLTTAEHA